jgi:hypothetical protein
VNRAASHAASQATPWQDYQRLGRYAARTHAVIARQGDQQEARQVRADQPMEAIRGRQMLLVVECRTVGNQESRASGDDAVMSCGAHATNIARTRPRLHP